MEWNDNFTAFTTGGSFGAIGGVYLDVPGIFLQLNPANFAMEFPVKLVATILLAFVGGVAGLLGKDWYQYNFRPWLQKRKILKNNNP
jgi:hypothetical protein